MYRTNCLRAAPLLEEFQFSFHQDNQEYASIFNDPFTIYKADPSPEVDAAWETISETPLLALSREQIIKLGKDPEYAVRIPKEFGKPCIASTRTQQEYITDTAMIAYGEEMYVGAMDGQHLIHCLNQLRKLAHYDYYYQSRWGDMSNMPALDASHRSHCIGLLLDALKCQPNVNVATFNWMEGINYPYPDFKTQRKCQNTDQLFQWIKERAGSRSGNEAWNFSRPEGAKEVSMPPQFKALQESLMI